VFMIPLRCSIPQNPGSLPAYSSNDEREILILGSIEHLPALSHLDNED
jgi:hypothetical protein